MNLRSNAVELMDLGPQRTNLLREVLMGLSKNQKTIPCKFLYDEKGSEIFEKICQLPEYYPTRAETEILSEYGPAIAKMIGDEALIIEPGSGNGDKVRLILKELRAPEGYVPIEISREILLRMVQKLSDDFPNLRVSPICADFTKDFDLPPLLGSRAKRKIIFFPGSTIGNFSPPDALQLLKKFSSLIGGKGGLIIGVDLKKEKSILEKAYADSQGVTAEFNLNLLERLNRDIDATFDLNTFKHEAIYNDELGRVEMHLKSKLSQLVRINQTVFHFRLGETIHTENSYKYSTEEFGELASKAGFNLMRHWQDSKKLFCVYYFEKV